MITEIAGYAFVWHDESIDGRSYTFARGAFDWWLAQCHGPRLLYGHEDRLQLASRMRGDLGLWSDDFGLAFKASVPNRLMPGIYDQLMAGEIGTSGSGERSLNLHRGFLNGFRGHRDTIASWAIGDIITRSTISEITLTPDPAFPAARVWLHEADYWDQQPHIRAQIDHWTEGQRSPRSGSGTVRGVEQATVVAKPIAQPVRMRPAGVNAFASPRGHRPVAPTNPFRIAVLNHMARYLVRGLAS